MDKKTLLSMAVVAAVSVVISGAPATARSGVVMQTGTVQSSDCSGSSSCTAVCGDCPAICGGYDKGFLKTSIDQEKPSLLPAGICEKL